MNQYLFLPETSLSHRNCLSSYLLVDRIWSLLLKSESYISRQYSYNPWCNSLISLHVRMLYPANISRKGDPYSCIHLYMYMVQFPSSLYSKKILKNLCMWCFRNIFGKNQMLYISLVSGTITVFITISILFDTCRVNTCTCNYVDWTENIGLKTGDDMKYPISWKI